MIKRVFLILIFIIPFYIYPLDLIKKDACVSKSFNDIYIYVDKNTPDYVLNKIISRNIGVFYNLSALNRQWLSSKIMQFKNVRNAVIVEDVSNKILLSNLYELADVLNYEYILFVKGTVLNKNSVVPPSVSVKGFISINGSFFIGNEKGVLVSPLDENDFPERGVVKNGLIFEKNSLAFINVNRSIDKINSETPLKIIVFWNDEKNIIKFIEKNYPVNKIRP